MYPLPRRVPVRSVENLRRMRSSRLIRIKAVAYILPLVYISRLSQIHLQVPFIDTAENAQNV